MRRPVRHTAWATLFAATAILAVASRSPAADDSPNWLDGTPLHQRLEEPIGPGGVSWSGVPLRRALNELSRAKQVAILLDRRVDPDQLLELSIDAVPLKEALVNIATSRTMGVTQLGPVIYFGLLDPIMRVRTVAALRHEEVNKLPTAARAKFAARRPMAWDDFATPRDLIQGLADQSGLRLFGLERVPHDLWAAADLPPMGLVERLTLVAGQFGLTFEISPQGDAIRLVPIPEEVALVRSYPGGKDPEALADRWASLLSEEQVKVVGQKVYVKGLLEDHERIATPRPATAAGPAGPTPIDEIRIDNLVVQNKRLPVVLDYISQKLSLQIEIDQQAVRRAGIELDQLVSFTVKDATVDQLLEAMLRPVGLKAQRRGRTVRIVPAGG